VAVIHLGLISNPGVESGIPFLAKFSHQRVFTPSRRANKLLCRFLSAKSMNTVNLVLKIRKRDFDEIKAILTLVNLDRGTKYRAVRTRKNAHK
jgi:hypothetical protein